MKRYTESEWKNLHPDVKEFINNSRIAAGGRAATSGLLTDQRGLLSPEDLRFIEDLEDSKSVKFTEDQIKEFRFMSNRYNNFSRLADSIVETAVGTQKVSTKIDELIDVLDSIPGAEGYGLGEEFVSRKYKGLPGKEALLSINHQIRKYKDPVLRSNITTILKSGGEAVSDSLLERIANDRVRPSSIASMEDKVTHLAAMTTEDKLSNPMRVGELEFGITKDLGITEHDPDKITKQQRLYIDSNELSGSGVRRISASQPGIDPFLGEIQGKIGQWNKYVKNVELPSEWDADRQADWRRKMTLEYGHLGPAGHPGYQYMVNWLSNLTPESEFFNKTSSAGMTGAEMENAQRLHSAQEGFIWTQQELDGLRSRLVEAGFREPDLDVLKLPESSAVLVEDPHRAQIIQGEPGGKAGLLYQGNPAGEYSGADSLSNEDHLLRMAYERSMPGFDYDNMRKARAEAETHLGAERAQVANLDKTTLQKFRTRVSELITEAQRSGRIPSMSVILDRAGRGLFGIAPIGLGLIDPKLAERWDNLGIHEGEKLVSEATKIVDEHLGTKIGEGAQQTEDVVLGVMDDLKSSDRFLDRARGHVGSFIYGTGKAAVTEIPGFLSSLFQGAADLKGDEFVNEWDRVVADRMNSWQKAALPENVMELYQEATPWKKYGGALQNRYP